MVAGTKRIDQGLARRTAPSGAKIIARNGQELIGIGEAEIVAVGDVMKADAVKRPQADRIKAGLRKPIGALPVSAAFSFTSAVKAAHNGAAQLVPATSFMGVPLSATT